MLHRRRNAFEPANRAQANVKIEHLAQRDVERANPAADRSGERALDRNEIVAKRRQRVFGEPVVIFVERLLAGVNFEPFDLALAAVSFFTAASSTVCEARQMSGPVPSPSMNGMTG